MKEAKLIMVFLFTSIILFVFSGLAQILFKEKYKAIIFTLFSGLATVLGLIPTTITLFNQNVLISNIDFNGLIENVQFVLDSLSSIFVFIILIIGFLSIIYSSKYLKSYRKKLSTHYFFLGIFIPSMILIVIVQNILMFLICWEIMSLSSFFLLLFENEKKEVRQNAINYLITMQIGALLLFCGFILLNIKTGSLNFTDFKGQLSNTIFIFFLIGFGIKAGFVPLHTWLPKAHPVAPSHVSALMSGVMIKTGIYGILRILTYIETPSLSISYIILLIGLLSAFFGILYATAQRNYKKMLAYSSIENIGLITISLGLGMLGLCYKNSLMAVFGFVGVFAHIINHSIFKSLLFLAAGSIDSKVHTKDCEKLGGLIKSMPYTAILFLAGSIAICALPPFNGFISEFFIYLSILNGLDSKNHFLFPILLLIIGLLAFVGAMTLIAFSNMFSTIFLGAPKSNKAQEVNEDNSKFMIVPIGILTIFTLLIGIFPILFMQLFVNPCLIFIKTSIIIPNQILINISVFNLVFLFLICILLAARGVLLKNRTVNKYKTWNCGYQNVNAKMQYSNYSFSRPFLGFLTPFFLRELDFKPIKELFPQKTHFKAKIIDIFDYYIIKPIVEFDKLIISKFYWIQGGNIQKYLLYGLIFLLITIVMAVKL